MLKDILLVTWIDPDKLMNFHCTSMHQWNELIIWHSLGQHIWRMKCTKRHLSLLVCNFQVEASNNPCRAEVHQRWSKFFHSFYMKARITTIATCVSKKQKQQCSPLTFDHFCCRQIDRQKVRQIEVGRPIYIWQICKHQTAKVKIGQSSSSCLFPKHILSLCQEWHDESSTNTSKFDSLRPVGPGWATA